MRPLTATDRIRQRLVQIIDQATADIARYTDSIKEATDPETGEIDPVVVVVDGSLLTAATRRRAMAQRELERMR